MPSVTEIKLNKVRPLFPARFAPMIASRSMYGEAVVICIIGANCLFNCISVTDGININEQYQSIGIDLQTEFEAFEPGRVSNVAILAWSKCKTPKCNLKWCSMNC